MLAYFASQLDLWWICILPYLLIGSVAVPVILVGLLFGSLQIFLIFWGLVDPEMIHKDFLPQLLQKLI
jgi:hypothetical protein